MDGQTRHEQILWRSKYKNPFSIFSQNLFFITNSCIKMSDKILEVRLG